MLKRILPALLIFMLCLSTTSALGDQAALEALYINPDRVYCADAILRLDDDITDEALLSRIQAIYDGGFQGVSFHMNACGTDMWDLLMNRLPDIGLGVCLSADFSVPDIAPSSEAAMQVLTVSDPAQPMTVQAGETIIDMVPFPAVTVEKPRLKVVYACKDDDTAIKLWDARDAARDDYVIPAEGGARYLVNWTAPGDGGAYRIIAMWSQCADSGTVNCFDERGAEALMRFWKDRYFSTPALLEKVKKGDVQILLDMPEPDYGGGFTWWCDDAAEQFEAVKGYDPMPYIALLADDGGDLTRERFANDWRDVMNRLCEARMCAPLKAWLDELGIASDIADRTDTEDLSIIGEDYSGESLHRLLDNAYKKYAAGIQRVSIDDNFGALNAHIGRIQQLLQTGTARTDLALIGGEKEKAIIHPAGLREHGYTCDDVNPETVDIESAGYRALVVCQAGFNPDGAEIVLMLAQRGIPVVLLEDAAQYSASINGVSGGGRRLGDILGELAALENVRIAPDDGVYAALSELGVTPCVETGGNLLAQTRADDDGNLYLFACGDAPDTNIITEISVDGLYVPYSIDAWTGAVTELAEYAHADGRTVFPIRLEAQGVALFALERSEGEVSGTIMVTSADSARMTSAGAVIRVTQDGTYYTAFNSGAEVDTEVEGLPEARDIEDWQSDMTARFDWDASVSDGAYIDFGESIDHGMTVEINGVKLNGINWFRPVVDAGAYLVNGQNTIRLVCEIDTAKPPAQAVLIPYRDVLIAG